MSPARDYAHDLSALLARPDMTWERFTRSIASWRNDEASQAAFREQAQQVDQRFATDPRQMPKAWWTAAQTGNEPLGYTLARSLRTNEMAAFEPCRRVHSLRALRAITTDDRCLSIEQLRDAADMRTLSYSFDSLHFDTVASLQPLAALNQLEHLTLTLVGGCGDVTPLAHLPSLRHLQIHVGGSPKGPPVSLTPLSGAPLKSLAVFFAGNHSGTLVTLPAFAHLQSLTLDSARCDLTPLEQSALTHLRLFSMPWQPVSLPQSLTHLALCDVPLPGLHALTHLTKLVRLELSCDIG